MWPQLQDIGGRTSVNRKQEKEREKESDRISGKGREQGMKTKTEIKIGDAFGHGKACIGFVTGGDPSVKKSEEFVRKMVQAGCDLIEIGIPFSDPIAEGPVIQEANLRALSAGIKMEHMFGLAAGVREKTDVPMVFLTYLNPVFRYGYEAFCAKCEETGVNGVLIPDMPYEEKKELLPYAEAHNVDLISVITPAPEQRIRMIAAEAKGFLYVMPSMGVTGGTGEINTDLGKIIALIRSVTDVPAAVGFRAGTSGQAAEMARPADGVIMESAIVSLIARHGEDAGEYIYDYVKKMKAAL